MSIKSLLLIGAVSIIGYSAFAETDPAAPKPTCPKCPCQFTAGATECDPKPVPGDPPKEMATSCDKDPEKK